MKLYLETTIPNFLVTDDAPDQRQITELFAQWLRLSPHEAFISDVVFQEISKAREPRQTLLRQALHALRASVLPVTDEARVLGQHYLAARILPARFQDDLLHAATATCHQMDMVVSWNMKHLANPSKVARINEVNRLHGWPLLRIHTPKEVLGL